MKLLHVAAASASPTWDVGSASLLWVEDATVHRLHPSSGTHTETVVPQAIGAALPRTNGGLVTNLRDGIGVRGIDDRLSWLVYWHRDGAEPGPAAIDHAGNLWAATTGQLIRVQPNGRAKVMLDGVTVTGLAATDRVHIATSRGVEVFDPVTGDRTALCATPAAGLCVDGDDHVWVAAPDGILRVSPTGDVEHVLDLAAPTGCCFGGPDFADLYVTAGSVFVASGLGAGTPTPRFPG